MSSQSQVSNKRPFSIDAIVVCEFEKVSGTRADWGTVISEELELNRAERARIAEACFLLLLPEYEWKAQDMTLLQSLDTVEEWIEVYEGICDDQDGVEKPMFTFNFK